MAMIAKFDPKQVKIVYVRCVGGTGPAASAIAPKVGPLGLSPKKISDEIAKATASWKGYRVTVKLTVQNREAKVTVVPSAAVLIERELNDPDLSERRRLERHNRVPNGNLSLEQIIEIAREMRPRSMAKKLEGTVKEILGTCQSLAVTVDGQHSHDIIEKIRSGEIYVPCD